VKKTALLVAKLAVSAALLIYLLSSTDLAALYRGTLRLETAGLGGLRAVLDLPGDKA